MKTILQNAGNKRWFRFCSQQHRRGYGFTVNVWLNRGQLPSYDAGFYVGADKQRKPAKFKDAGYKVGVGYRIRVKPKGGVSDEWPFLNSK
jgi:hypothetical protein